MIIFNFILVFTVLFAAIILVLRKIFFSDTNSALNRLNDARLQTERKQMELEEKMVKCEEQCRALIAESQKKAEDVMRASIQEAEKKGKEILEKSRTQGQDIVQKANEMKETMRKEIAKELEVKMIDFGRDILKQMLPKHITPLFNEGLYTDFVKELEIIDAKYMKDFKAAELITAAELPDKFSKAFKEILAKKVGHPVEISFKTDPSILGGIILRFGTMVLDGSINAKLKETAEAMKKQLDKR